MTGDVDRQMRVDSDGPRGLLDQGSVVGEASTLLERYALTLGSRRGRVRALVLRAASTAELRLEVDHSNHEGSAAVAPDTDGEREGNAGADFDHHAFVGEHGPPVADYLAHLEDAALGWH